MRRAPPVLLFLVALLAFALPPGLRAQELPQPLPAEASRGFHLEQNYPNPVDPETWIPYYLEESVFKEGRPGVVSIRIYNILRQLVAVPTAVGHPRGKNVPVTNLRFTEPGRKVAYWNGKDQQGRRVPSGLYYCELVVNDRSDFIRIVVVTPRKRSRFPIPLIRNGRSD
jgi:hypothetical protein